MTYEYPNVSATSPGIILVDTCTIKAKYNANDEDEFLDKLVIYECILFDLLWNGYSSDDRRITWRLCHRRDFLSDLTSQFDSSDYLRSELYSKWAGFGQIHRRRCLWHRTPLLPVVPLLYVS